MSADALSRCLDNELAHVTNMSSYIQELIRVAYPQDSQCVALFHALKSNEYKYSDSQFSARLRAGLY